MAERYNPYVGPRAFETENRHDFKGRDREKRQLADLVIAQRAVLLYSPSGAGKTSLIKAGLVPDLERRRMGVLPVARVGGDAPPEARNPFVYNVLSTMADEDVVPEDLLALTLEDGLATYLPGGRRPVLLVLDQFEEVFTLYPGRYEARRAFFVELQGVLDKWPRLGLLLAMREEYLAYLDPYAAMLPDRLRTHFRLELLDPEAALLAIQEPARAQKVDFSDAAAQKLVADLRQIQERALDGKIVFREGEFVEPVQLQVVCHQIWERVVKAAAHDAPVSIVEADIEAGGDVDAALGDYYATSVKTVAEKTGTNERDIREWCEGRLITSQGFRGQVPRGEGVDGAVVHQLEDAHLLRAEKRAGTVWYELSHDRLVAPVRADNAVWFELNLHLVQNTAALWEKENRPPSLLLSGDDLSDAESWAETNEMTDIERAFLEACRDRRAMEEREQRQARRIRRWAVGAGVLAMLAIVFAVVAFWQMQQATEAEDDAVVAADAAATAVIIAEDERVRAEGALVTAEEAKLTAEANRLEAENAKLTAEDERDRAEEQAQISLTRQLAAEALINSELRPQHSVLLAIEAYSRTTVLEDGRIPDVQQSLRKVMTMIGGIPLTTYQGSIDFVAFSSDGRWLVTAGDGGAWVWDMTSLYPIGQVLMENQGAVTAVVFYIYQDEPYLALANSKGEIRLWQGDNWAADPVLLEGHTASITSLAFHPDEPWLVSGDQNAEVRLWNFQDLRFRQLGGHTSRVEVVAFSLDGHWLATGSGSRDAEVRLWDMTESFSFDSTEPISPIWRRNGDTNEVFAIAFSVDSLWMASAGYDGRIRLWSLEDLGAQPTELEGHTSRVLDLAFSPNGEWLASVGWNYSAFLWNLKNLDAPPEILQGHEFALSDVAFSPDASGRWLATASDDNTIRVWDTYDLTAGPLVLRGHDSHVVSIAFRPPDGLWLASAGSYDQTARLWDLLHPIADPILLDDGYDVGATAFSPDGHWLATAERWGDGVVLRDMNDLDRTIGLEGHNDRIRDLTFSSDGPESWLMTGSEDGTARLWPMSGFTATNSTSITRSVVISGQHKVEDNKGIEGVAVSLDGRWAATCGYDKKARLWDISELTPDMSEMVLRTPAVVFGGHQGVVKSVAFSPDGDWLATGSWDGRIRLWDISGISGVEDVEWATSVLTLEHAGGVEDVAFSPDGRWLATSSTDETAKLWEVLRLQDYREGLQPRILQRHESDVVAVTFSPYPAYQPTRWLATAGSWDRTAQIWNLTDLDSGPVILRGHNYVEDVAFSPDGRWLATASRDQTTRLWHLQVDELRDLACRTAGRNLALEEWRQYFGDEPYRATCPNLPVPEGVASP